MKRVHAPRTGPRGEDSVYAGGSRTDPFGILVAEHALLRQRVARVLAAARGETSSVGRALGALTESLRIHQRREDRALLPLCERLFGGRDGAASVLRDDHAAIIERLEALTREAASTGRISPLRLENTLHELEDHLGKEERVLFPLTAALLSGTESSDLASRLRAAHLGGPGDRL